MKRFRIRYEIDVVLDADAIWPDGDAPKNPTAADVENLLREDCRTHATLEDWNLSDDADLTVTEVPDVG